MKVVKLLFLGFITNLMCFDLLFAQDFEVSPVIVEFQTNPGETETRALTIRNHSAKKQDFVFRFGDFEMDETGSRKLMEPGQSPHSMHNFITISPSFITLNPNEERSVNVTIRVPANENTTKWGTIFVEAAKEQTLSDIDKSLATGIKVRPRIVVIVTQSPPGNTNYSGKISSLKEITKEGDEFKRFEVLITNNGDKIFDAKVYLTFANLTTGAEIKMDPTKSKIFPGQTRKVELMALKPIPKGKYALAAIMDYSKYNPIEGTQILFEVK